MIRRQPLRARNKLVSKLPVTGELLRGTLLERTVRHRSGCPKCARGEGHQVFVLTVTYPGGRTRQFSVRRERVEKVRPEPQSGSDARIAARSHWMRSVTSRATSTEPSTSPVGSKAGTMVSSVKRGMVR